MAESINGVDVENPFPGTDVEVVNVPPATVEADVVEAPQPPFVEGGEVTSE